MAPETTSGTASGRFTSSSSGSFIDSMTTAKLVSYLKKMVVMAFAINGIVLLSYLLKFHDGLSADQAVWGQFGDFVGGALNPFLGFLSLIALLATIVLQMRQMELQREELDNSRQELAATRADLALSTAAQQDSARALVAQHQSIAQQTFESTFFQLVKLHHDIVSGIDLRKSNVVIAQGRDCFAAFKNRMGGCLLPLNVEPTTTTPADLVNAYDRFYKQDGHEVGHYFRNLYRIFKFIAQSPIQDKKAYTGIIRAQLSNYELQLLFYNGLSSQGEKFKPLLEDFAAFENMPLDEVSVHHLKFYGLGAYGDQMDAVRRKTAEVANDATE